MPKRHEVAINSGYLDFLGGGLGHSLWLSNNRVLESLVQLGLSVQGPREGRREDPKCRQCTVSL